MTTALGIIETNSVPLGIQAGDEMLKSANVSLFSAQSVCPGKYVVIVFGTAAAVKAAVAAGKKAAAHSLVDNLILSAVHETLIPAINACTEASAQKPVALGILETFSICSAVYAADNAAKAANITLLEVRLGRGLGGKSFVLLCGKDVAAVSAAIKAAETDEHVAGLFGDSVVIPSPHEDIFKAIL